MRFQGQDKLGFFPLPLSEAVRLRRWLNFPEQFSALDPCAGDGAAFNTLLEPAMRCAMGLRLTHIGLRRPGLRESMFCTPTHSMSGAARSRSP